MDSNIAFKIIRCFIDGTMPARYRERVAGWLVSDSDAAEKDTALKLIYEQTEGDDSDIAASLSVFRAWRSTYEKSRSRRLRVTRMARYAAMFILPIITGLAVWHYSANHYSTASELLEYYVPDGQTGKLSLSDGTVVTINGGTSFIYPREFSDNAGNRKVYLRGEAHFDVAKDAEHPFIVSVGKLKVKVLGTHFDVKAYNLDRYITTTLEKGLVEVYDDKRSEILRPGEQAAYCIDSDRLTKYKVDASKYDCWTNGSLHFEQQTLENILSDLRHRYGVRFHTDVSVNLSTRYTMNFQPMETIDDVMSVLKRLTKGLRYNKKGKTIMLYKERKEAGA